MSSPGPAHCPKCGEQVVAAEGGKCNSCHEILPQELLADAQSPPQADQAGDVTVAEEEQVTTGAMAVGVAFVAIVLCAIGWAIYRVMGVFIPQHGFWKSVLYVVGLFALVAVFAAGRMLFSERVIAPLINSKEKKD